MLTSLPIHCVLAISFMGLVFCVVVYYALPRQGFTLHQRPAVLVALVVVITLVVRLIPAVVLPRGAGYDIESFRRVSETFLKGVAFVLWISPGLDARQHNLT